MSKKTAEEVLNKVAEDCFNATADEIFYDGQPEYIIKAMKSYHTQKLKELEEELGERVVLYNEKYQKHIKDDNHASAGGAWHKAQGIKEAIQLIESHSQCD